MKIAIVGHLKYPIAKPFAGGLEAFTYDFVNALQKRGHDVTLFAAGDSDPSLPLVSAVDKATVLDSQDRFGETDDHWIEAVEDAAYTNVMQNICSQSDFDIVHNHTLSPIPLRYADRLGSRLVTTLHVPPLPRLRNELMSKFAQDCGKFVNISHANANAWSTLLPNQSVIHNGVNVGFWGKCCDTKQHRAIWFGRILADKGTHLAIKAAHLAGLPIDIVGPIADQAYFDNEILPRLRETDCYHGHQTHQQLCSLISRSKVALVTPCWDEPFGLVVAEALACGTPVAGFRRGALPEIVSPSVGCLAAPDDVLGLAHAIKACQTLDGAACRRRVQDLFSINAMVSGYEHVYRSMYVRGKSVTHQGHAAPQPQSVMQAQPQDALVPAGHI